MHVIAGDLSGFTGARLARTAAAAATLWAHATAQLVMPLLLLALAADASGYEFNRPEGWPSLARLCALSGRFHGVLSLFSTAGVLENSAPQAPADGACSVHSSRSCCGSSSASCIHARYCGVHMVVSVAQVGRCEDPRMHRSGVEAAREHAAGVTGGGGSTYDGPHGGSWHPDHGRLPPAATQPAGNSNPLLLVAALAATATVVRLLCGENLRDRIARCALTA